MKTKAAQTFREWEERSRVPECVPVVLFDRSLWTRFVGLFKRRKAVRAAGLAFATLTLLALPAASISKSDYVTRLESTAWNQVLHGVLLPVHLHREASRPVLGSQNVERVRR